MIVERPTLIGLELGILRFCILVILCFTNGESKTVTLMNPLHNGWSYTGHVIWSFACRYISFSNSIALCTSPHVYPL